MINNQQTINSPGLDCISVSDLEFLFGVEATGSMKQYFNYYYPYSSVVGPIISGEIVCFSG